MQRSSCTVSHLRTKNDEKATAHKRNCGQSLSRRSWSGGGNSFGEMNGGEVEEKRSQEAKASFEEGGGGCRLGIYLLTWPPFPSRGEI